MKRVIACIASVFILGCAAGKAVVREGDHQHTVDVGDYRIVVRHPFRLIHAEENTFKVPDFEIDLVSYPVRQQIFVFAAPPAGRWKTKRVLGVTVRTLMTSAAWRGEVEFREEKSTDKVKIRHNGACELSGMRGACMVATAEAIDLERLTQASGSEQDVESTGLVENRVLVTFGKTLGRSRILLIHYLEMTRQEPAEPADYLWRAGRIFEVHKR